MRIDVVCFTARGEELGRRLSRALAGEGDVAAVERCGEKSGQTLRRWTQARFHAADALVFIGAAGIAVRAVAPELVSKTADPAVVVVDEAGRFAVSLLSGHIGGANALARRVARILGATAVITTATDINGLTAIDEWARSQGMAIRNPERIKAVSAKLLAGGTIALESPFPAVPGPPPGFELVENDGDVVVDVRKSGRAEALRLVPPAAILGVGCRRGVSVEAVEGAFLELCARMGFFPEAFFLVCSVDLKKAEPGLLAFCEGRGLPLRTFSASELREARGEFAASRFVRAVTGVDNVCERAVAAGGGRPAAGKTVFPGVAMAIGVRDYALDFGEYGVADG